MEKLWLGLDVGSVSVKLAALVRDPGENILERITGSEDFFLWRDDNRRLPDHAFLILSNYSRHQGEPRQKVKSLLRSFEEIVPPDHIQGIWITGSGGKEIGEKEGFHTINTFRAAAEGIGTLYPDVKTVFELGGERSRYLLLGRDDSGKVHIRDYEMNGECAAGTGSFFDQQAGRLKYSIEEAGEIVGKTGRYPGIAGRCSVFAKSDMIHAQQRGYTPPEVLKGLCHAVVRNFKGSVTKGKRIEFPVAIIGGMAFNQGIIQAFREQFSFSDGDMIIPENPAWTGAAGSALIGFGKNQARAEARADRKGKTYPTVKPLSMENVRLLRDQTESFRFPENGPVNAFLGIDIGSVSTNLALLDESGQLIYGIYRMTEGRPVEVVKDALGEMASVVKDRVHVRGAGTTGSGRELIGILAGADVIKDEITAHKTGALHVSRHYLRQDVDTIFEIGGQDSKFISIRNGIVTDFSLNEACAAGTGSFLEEQAREIGIQIRGEFARLALKSRHPLKLGERCTVFMEKEIVPYLHKGVSREDIVAGLAYSVVHNYLNRVVKKRRIGDVIFFQGGTAYNDSVAAAFASVLGKEIIVPPYNGIIGAIGAALLAKEYVHEGKTAFRGWDLSRVSWNLREFTCRACSNECAVQEFEVEREKSYWGDKCSDRYRKHSKSRNEARLPDLVRWRDELLFSSPKKSSVQSPRGTIGIPRILYFFDRLPFWRTYFESLGFEVILSDSSHQDTIHAGLEATVAEPCFPMQMAHGHLLNLSEKKADCIFLPNTVNEEDPTNSIASFICPWAQTLPLVIRQTPAFSEMTSRLLSPNIQFRNGPAFVEMRMREIMRPWRIRKSENRHALDLANKAHQMFRSRLQDKGKRALDQILQEKVPGIVLLGRPYNLYDTGLNLNIPSKLRDIYGINVIPMDFLPADQTDIRPVHDHMFWNYGRKILQAARFVRGYPDLHLMAISNFKCGPDSYIRHYIEDASGEPFLFLQLDSHANDAGVMTRIEAFLESKGMI